MALNASGILMAIEVLFLLEIPHEDLLLSIATLEYQLTTKASNFYLEWLPAFFEFFGSLFQALLY